MSYVLCVIDMQPTFDIVPGSRVANNSEREIRKAIQDKAPIIMVEYMPGDATIEQLSKVASEAMDKFKVVKKYRDDGSNVITKTIKDNDFPSKHIKMIGVNTDCCVYRTAVGLTTTLPGAKIEIVADACDSKWSPHSHEDGIKRLKDLGCHISNH